MESIEQMIKRLCPEGVEFVKLGEVCTLERGKVFSKKYIEENKGDYPVYSSQTANNGELGRIGTYNYNGEFLTWTTDGAYAGTIFYRKGKFSITNVCGLIKNNERLFNIRFLYHWLSVKAKEYVYEGMGNPKLMSNQAAEILIPVPPLEIQSRIVEVLDMMTTLTAELEAELEARKQQYEYYRNKLLTFNENGDDKQVVWKTLGKICVSICSGGTPSRNKSEYFMGNIPWLRTQEVDWADVYDTEIKITEEAVNNSSAKIIPANCIIIAMYGATAAKACINRIELTTNQACCNLQIDSEVALYKYVYYWICNNYEQLKSLGEGSQNNLNAKKIKDYKIPVPSLAEQSRIVGILDRFEALTTDLQSGLPAEIEARRQQYEYYRNKLLTFDVA